MSTRGRHITAAVLLASYLLASAGAGLHALREYQEGAEPGPMAMVPGGAHGGCEHHACHRVPVVPNAAGNGERTSESVPVPSQHPDDCAVCRFQLIKKQVENVSLAATLSRDCPDPIVLDVPLYRVASLLATPESRAPPVPA